jgi:hypothetical protein
VSENNLRNWHQNAKLQLERILLQEAFDIPSLWFTLDETVLYFNRDAAKKNNRVLSKKSIQVVYRPRIIEKYAPCSMAFSICCRQY